MNEAEPLAVLPNLSRRRRWPEVMDQPGLDRDLHRQALAALARVNRATFTVAGLWPRVLDIAGAAGPEPIRVLDVGCGAGEVALGLLRRARRAGRRLEVAGCDLSPVAVELAAERAADEGLAARFFELDVMDGPLPRAWDVLVSSFFLHHFDDGDAGDLLGRMAAAARRGLVVDDLVRSRAGYLYAALGGRLLTRSPVVKVDAPRSVAGAWTHGEIERLAEGAGLAGARIEHRWPERFLLTWRRP